MLKPAMRAKKVVTTDETSPPPVGQVPREAQRKWGKDMMEARFTIVPNVLLERMHALGLDSTDLVVLLHLIKHWWKKENLPYPGINSIARMMNVHRRTVQRRLHKLTKQLMLVTAHERRSRYGDNETNLYSFEGLIAEATKLAKEMVQERERRRLDDAKRAARGRRRAS